MRMLRCASSSTSWRPRQRRRAAWRLMARPAPWHAELKARVSLTSVPVSMYELVPMLPPMSTGWPVSERSSGSAG